jgi:hypothetical protein
MDVEVRLSAVVVAADTAGPVVLVVDDASGLSALPAGPLDPAADRTLEMALRGFLKDQAGFEAGYVEQLYTFGDLGRETPQADTGESARVLSIGYLALAQKTARLSRTDARWAPWYEFFGWEDRRGGAAVLEPDALLAQAGDKPSLRKRINAAFGFGNTRWNEERALERFELLYELALVEESPRDGRADGAGLLPGKAMRSDHRRILATAIGRLRGKLKYRPVVFDLMPQTFTLFELQRVVEGIVGLDIHKQNFRRVVEGGGLITPTGAIAEETGGRPARLYRLVEGLDRSGPVGGLSIPKARP